MTASATMNAVQMHCYGPPEVLTYGAADIPVLGPQDVRVRTLFAAVNHTDLRIRAGDWPIRKAEPFPYTPGVEVVGIIDDIGCEVSQWQPGQKVITMMQGLGGVLAQRAGGYADFVTVDAQVLAEIPSDVEPAAVAALGLGAVTAFEGLRKLGPLAGRRLIVTGAAGGVGSSATAIAHAAGASVVGIVRQVPDVEYVRSLGASEVVIADDFDTKLERDGADAVLDTVAGNLFTPCVKALRPGGVLCLVGAVGGGTVGFDAWDLIKPITLTGYSTEALDGAALRSAVTEISDMLQRKAISPPKHGIVPLAAAAQAHRLLDQRKLRGRVLLDPSQADNAATIA